MKRDLTSKARRVLTFFGGKGGAIDLADALTGPGNNALNISCPDLCGATFALAASKRVSSKQGGQSWYAHCDGGGSFACPHLLRGHRRASVTATEGVVVLLVFSGVRVEVDDSGGCHAIGLESTTSMARTTAEE